MIEKFSMQIPLWNAASLRWSAYEPTANSKRLFSSNMLPEQESYSLDLSCDQQKQAGHVTKMKHLTLKTNL